VFELILGDSGEEEKEMFSPVINLSALLIDSLEILS
jgi:hypothetical protein